MIREEVFVDVAMDWHGSETRIPPEVVAICGVAVSDFYPGMDGEIKREGHWCRIDCN